MFLPAYVLVCAWYTTRIKIYAAYAAGLTIFQWYDYDIYVSNRRHYTWFISCRCSTYVAGIIQLAVLQRNEKSVSSEGTELPR